MDPKVYLSVTTIPSRFRDPIFLHHLLFLQKQTESFEKLFLTLSRWYRRFPEEALDQEIVARLAEMEWIDIIWLENDLGPASKFMGPLLHRSEALHNQLLIVIDDDRFYDKEMIRIYKNFFRTHKGIRVASGNQFFYFNEMFYKLMDSRYLKIRESEEKYLAAFMSFALDCSFDWTPLVDYTRTILENMPDAFFHDEGILLNFCRFLNIRVFYITYKFINTIQEEMTSSLVLGNFVDRAKTEEEIMKFTNQHHLLGCQYSPPPQKIRRTVRSGFC